MRLSGYLTVVVIPHVSGDESARTWKSYEIFNK
jgi:hypothetical protein